jgi:hypothetical protein
MRARQVQSDRFTVLRAEAETIINRLKVLDEKGERKILLSELRNLIAKLEVEAMRE